MDIRLKLIACNTVAEELDGMLPSGMETAFMEFGLHAYPDRLKKELQEEIDHTDGTRTILLGYGMCSMSILGLTSSKHRLVVPRVHDCIGIFLGSHEVYKEQVRSTPGTYYLTRGWIDYGGDPYKVFLRWQEEYGDKRARLLLEKTIGNYTRLAYIETAPEEQTHYLDYARSAADKLGLRFEKLSGNRTLLKKLITGEWDNDFVVIEPGEKATIQDFSK